MNFQKLFGKKSKSSSSSSNNFDHVERAEPVARSSVQQQQQQRERAPIRENIHTEAILNVHSIDASNVLTGSQDRTLVWYDCGNRRIRRRWTGHEHDIMKVRYAHVLNLVVSTSRDRTIRFWNPNADACVQKLIGHELVVTAIDFNPDNSVMVSGSRDNKVIFWDMKSGQILKTITIGRNLITDAKWSHDGTFIAQTGEDKETKMYDARNMTQVMSFPKKQYIQVSCDISSDDRYLMTTSNGFNGSGAEISLWDIRQRKLLSELYGHRATVNCGRFVDQAGSMIISCSNDGRAILWNVQLNAVLAELDVDIATPLTSITALSTQNFVTGGLNGKLSFIQRTSRELQLTDQI